MFIILAGSAGRNGVLFTWTKRENNLRIEILPGYYNWPHGTQGITDLIQNHFADARKAFGFVHTGTDELTTQEEISVVPLLVIQVVCLLLFCKNMKWTRNQKYE